MAAQDIFKPIATGAIPSSISSRNDHPLKKEHINSDGPVSTNKFYANFFLGSQGNPVWTHPYSVHWAKGKGVSKSNGMSISHIEADKLALGDPQANIPGNPVKFFINPVGIESVVLSATELGTSSVLSVSEPTAFSAQAVLQPQNGSGSSITYPVVQGMGFITGIYKNLQPAIQTGVFFRQFTPAGSPKPGVFKYGALLEDGFTWFIYVTPDNGTDPKFQLASNSSINGPKGFSGTIQVAKAPKDGAAEAVYDKHAGVYPTGVTISGSVSTSNASGSYKFSFKKAGKNADNTPLLMFALPHHVESFDSATQGRKTSVQLRTTTKGVATAYTADSWTMNETNLPISMGFAPWSPNLGNGSEVSAAVKDTIKNQAKTELLQDVNAQTNLDSMYFSGKALGKFAAMVYAVHEIAQDPSRSSAAFQALKLAFKRFVDNKQKYPLVYDTVWKGVVSSASYVTGDSGQDFGNTYYNDHHFHYGYFVYAAAIIGHLDPSWLDSNKAWVNTLIRDAADSVSNDKLFPFSRGFDWYNGHSWAKGLFESIDGKDQESSSEDTMFAYATKMWGKTIGDASMEARGNMQLAILSRTLRNYFLMDSKNANQPGKFIANKVTGILFENKADHTTYFGNNLEYIQGIHMIPLIPSSAYTRRKVFVKEEWDALFAPGSSCPADKVQGGWKGILYANLAIIDPAKAWEFFSQQNFDYSWIDGGASRTWYLAYVAGLGGGPK